jgi:serine protease
MKIGGGLGHNTNSGWPIASILDALNEVELLAKLPPQPVNQPIVAVSISASGYVSQDIDCHPDSDGAKIDAIAGRLKQLGIAVVMTAGNQASTTSTGAWTCGKNVIVVGATEVSMPTQPTDYTNISSKVALFAPVGQGNYPCDDRNCLMTTWKTQGSFVVWGTSFAAPQVAGAFAVLRHKYGQSPTVDQLLHLMQESGGLLSGPRATQANAQAKVLNIGNALKMSSYLID